MVFLRDDTYNISSFNNNGGPNEEPAGSSIRPCSVHFITEPIGDAEQELESDLDFNFWFGEFLLDPDFASTGTQHDTAPLTIEVFVKILLFLQWPPAVTKSGQIFQQHREDPL